MVDPHSHAETWTVDYVEGGRFHRFFDSLDEYEQAVLVAAIEHVLERLGIDICQGEWGKSLGRGLYEFRVRKSLRTILNAFAPQHPTLRSTPSNRTVLLRVFCTFHGRRIVLLLGGYDKKKDPSSKRQNKEITAARKELRAWRND